MTTASIANMQQVADSLDSSNLGYDQGQRWSFLDQRYRTIVYGGETDCSASCGAIAWLAGYPVDLSGTFYTGNFAAKLKDAGFEVLRFVDLNQVRPGDFLVTPGAHVVFVRSPTQWWSAEVDERGKSSGGQAGDQTGRETRYRAPYMRSGGWTYIVRSLRTEVAVDANLLSSKGLSVDGRFGPATIRALQKWLGVTVDGKIGANTRKALQKRLGVSVDGVWGQVTVRALQRLIDVKADGVWGPNTTSGLQTYLNQQVTL